LRGLCKHQEALDAYAQAESTYDEQLWGGRGFSLARLNRSDKAAEAFNKSLSASQKVLDKDNKSAYAWFWKGEALRGLGRYQESLESYDHALEIGPEKAISARRGKGFVLKSLSRDSEADAAFAEAKELGYQG
ncbi:MAG: tetratricopeptide repeat protein, partial [Methanothrix sp.]|nr:tetratricopeptide repeat protein [Methanothrix sp.]